MEIPENARIKLFRCGTVCEVVYVNRKNSKQNIVQLKDKTYLNLKTGEIKVCKEAGGNRTEHVQSLRRTFQNLRRIINANTTGNMRNKCLFITLTYKEPMLNNERLRQDFELFRKRMNYYLKKERGVSVPEYITVVEPQVVSRYAWHIHGIFIWKEERTAPFIENAIIAELWGKGFVNVRSLSNIGALGNYLTAYLSDVPIPADDLKGEERQTDKKKKVAKGARLWLYPKGMRIYRVSRGIIRPKVEYLSYKQVKGDKNLKKTYHHERMIEREDEREPIEIIQESFIELDKSIKFKV